MKSCLQCKDFDCLDQGNANHNACEDFTSEEVGASAPAPSPMSAEGREWYEAQMNALREEMDERMSVIENQFDKLVDGLRNAAVEAWTV